MIGGVSVLDAIRFSTSLLNLISGHSCFDIIVYHIKSSRVGFDLHGFPLEVEVAIKFKWFGSWHTRRQNLTI